MSNTQLAQLLTEHAWYVDHLVRGYCLRCLDGDGKLRRFSTVEEFAAHLVELILAEYLVIPRTPANVSAEEAQAAFDRAKSQRHTWECLSRTRIGVPALDACDCPLPENGDTQ
ncbi:hypothetical protein [Nocardia australiensis]|uniref:hypothetical protein n=1 Tax=Nocardia australiensis TaxID=2887191 RepID=UPI001D134588|nr:hypothetical protein [Nocardia australiensis]